MTLEQRKYIEQHSDLIENNKWKDFFKDNFLRGMGGILLDAGIDFLSYLEEVPDDVFYRCDQIYRIKIPNNIRRIGKSSFFRCSSITSITIPDSVTSIGESAFLRCNNLEHVTIGAGTKNIDEDAFAICNRLKEIKFNGTIAEFKGIKKSRSFIDHSVTVICSDGDLVYKKA